MSTNDSFYFTSESVTEGHPDKICDQISDAVLDAVLAVDPLGRVACEVSITTGLVLVSGEITTEAYLDIPAIVRKTIKRIGYNSSEIGFDASTCGIIVALDRQSPDIAQGVNQAYEVRSLDGHSTDPDLDTVGAGDQGMMFGYATNETPEYLPLPITLAHKLARRLSEVRKDGTLSYLRPDGKSQVTVFYENGVPKYVDTVVLSSQHSPDVADEEIRKDITEYVLDVVIPEELRSPDIRLFVNPTGRFVVGGPQGDSGLTGRKIIVDTYGGYARHGGGAFSGKDPTKVDRSAAYYARYVAKNIVASGAADKVEVQLSYAIGVARPISILIETFGTSRVSSENLAQAVDEVFDFRPAAIIEQLNLRRPIYQQTAAYGHFGRSEPDFTWEATDRVGYLRKALGFEHLEVELLVEAALVE